MIELVPMFPILDVPKCTSYLLAKPFVPNLAPARECILLLRKVVTKIGIIPIDKKGKSLNLKWIYKVQTFVRESSGGQVKYKNWPPAGVLYYINFQNQGGAAAPLAAP